MENNQNRNTIKAALWGMFPSLESFKRFERDDQEIAASAIPEIIQWAFKEGLILSDEQAEFQRFIEANSTLLTAQKPKPGYDFRNLLNDILKDHPVKWLVKRLNEVSQVFDMPKIQESMLTRLKKDFLRTRINTAKKCCCLRVLAFWICKTQPRRGWHYEAIASLPGLIEQHSKIEAREGVRIAFYLRSQGTLVEPSAIRWLKNEIKNSICDLKLFHIKTEVESSGATVFLNIPRLIGKTDAPELYAQAICNSIGIAHQIAVRWALSKYCGQQKK